MSEVVQQGANDLEKASPKNRGDEFAQQALPHTNVMFAVARRMAGNEKDAEDLVQEGMLRAFRFFDKFEQGTNLRAWLIKVMTNIFLNKVKKDSKRPPIVEFESVQEIIGEIEEDWTGVTSDSEDFREYLDDDVVKALDELPEEYRVPVLLSAVDGLSYREIALAMDCPVGTVMSRLYRGRRMLERRLRAYAQKTGFIKGGEEDEVL